MSIFQGIVFGIIGFVLFTAIMVFIVYLFVSIPSLIKKPFEKKVNQIREQYPLAYYDFIETNHISSFETSIIELIRIIQSSSDWNETEERLKEQKRRKQIANSYNTWEKEQEDYRNNCLIIAKETMSNFGWYPYDIPFTKLNEREETVQGKYKVWQFFPGAYCLESDLDYSDFVSFKSNTKNLIRFKSKEVCWQKSIYEKINAFINELAKKYQISVYLNANKEEWSSESLNYHYNDIFESEFVSDEIEIYNSVFDPTLNGEPLNSKLKNRHIIIIDMQTENGQLKSVCKRIIDNNKDKRPLITYISLLKGYDREEMIDLINNEKKKRKEEEKQLMYASLTTNAKEEDFEKAITDENGIIYSYDGQKVLGVSSPYITSCCIKSGTLVIIDEAFSDFWNEIEGNYLDQIIIPETIIKIGSNPFSGRVSKVICKSSKFEIIDDVLYDKNTSKKKLIQCFNRNANNEGKNNNKVIIPEGVNIIGEKSFYDCELESITIPNTVNKIEKNPFVSVNVIKNNPLEIICNSKYFVVDNYALYDIQTNTLISYFGKDKHFTINAGTRRIGELAFWGATTLESIYLPKSLESFENYKCTFGYTWETLKKVLIPEGFKNKFERLLPEHINILVEVPQEIPIEYKSDKETIINLLRNNGINCFYHFTARDNVALIKQHGGLYSWWSLKQKNIKVPFLGGEGFGQQLDVRHGLQDYVRLSFCDDHPMIFKHQQNGIDLVLLKIDIEVATWKDSLFSDINATDNNHHHGGNISDLRMVDFNAVKRNFVSRDDDDFKPHQAEVMVKTFIPAKYIINLDSPLPL